MAFKAGALGGLELRIALERLALLVHAGRAHHFAVGRVDIAGAGVAGILVHRLEVAGLQIEQADLGPEVRADPGDQHVVGIQRKTAGHRAARRDADTVFRRLADIAGAAEVDEGFLELLERRVGQQEFHRPGAGRADRGAFCAARQAAGEGLADGDLDTAVLEGLNADELRFLPIRRGGDRRLRQVCQVPGRDHGAVSVLAGGRADQGDHGLAIG